MIAQNVHDAERKARLEHGALLVDVKIEPVPRHSDDAEIGAVGAVGAPVGAVGLCDAAQTPDGADEGADEEQVDKGDEFGRVFGARVEEQRA